MRRLAIWMVAAALNVDLVMLRAAKWTVEMAEEWLSLSQGRIERGLMMAFLAGYVTVGWHSWWLLLFPFTAWGCWIQHRMPAARRAARIASSHSIFWRLASIANLLFFLLIDGLAVALQGFQWWIVPVLIVIVSYPCFEYVTALPSRKDGLGKKRKLALAKLKAMFGTGWMPVPEGGRV